MISHHRHRLFKPDDYLLQEGDVLFARTGASVGKTYIYRRSDGDFVFCRLPYPSKNQKAIMMDFLFQNTLTDSYDSYIRITSQRSDSLVSMLRRLILHYLFQVLLNRRKSELIFSHLDSLSPFISVSLKNLKISKNLALKRCLCKENRLN